MVRGIVVTHGDLAQEILATAKLVYGNFDGCYAVTNYAKSQEILTQEIESLLKESNDPAVLFVDLFGGSCCHTCLRLQRRYGNIRIVSGINLPLFIAFLNKRDEVPFECLGDEIVRRGQESICEVDLEGL